METSTEKRTEILHSRVSERVSKAALEYAHDRDISVSDLILLLLTRHLFDR